MSDQSHNFFVLSDADNWHLQVALSCSPQTDHLLLYHHISVTALQHIDRVRLTLFIIASNFKSRKSRTLEYTSRFEIEISPFATAGDNESGRYYTTTTEYGVLLSLKLTNHKLTKYSKCKLLEFADPLILCVT
jgi:hypothetical protein